MNKMTYSSDADHNLTFYLQKYIDLLKYCTHNKPRMSAKDAAFELNEANIKLSYHFAQTKMRTLKRADFCSEYAAILGLRWKIKMY